MIENKLKYVVDSLLSDYVSDEYPKWNDLISVFCEYLDNNTHGKIVNILDNLNYNTIYPELIDEYIGNYFKDVIDSTQYQLTENNKQLFISLSKILTGTKGTRQSYDFLFKYLTDFELNNSEGSTSYIDAFTIGYEENEGWWKTGDFNFYNGNIIHDGTYTYEFDVGQPYTYKFVVDEQKKSVVSLINSLHPAGFHYEFTTKYKFIDDLLITDDFCVNITYRFHYNDKYVYDGTITYSGTKTVDECSLI